MDYPKDLAMLYDYEFLLDHYHRFNHPRGGLLIIWHCLTVVLMKPLTQNVAPQCENFS